MHFTYKILPIILYFIVGVIALIMAHKSLFSKTFLSFHEKAVGITLDKLDINIQNIILSLMRTTGLGFLIVGILLLFVPLISYFKSETMIMLFIPFICLIYCFGLFLVNYKLYKISDAETPWKGSLISVIIIIVGIIISIF
jgi:hypothetical protein